MDRRNIPLAAGLVMLPALVFQDHLITLMLQVLMLIILQLLLRRSVRVLPNLIMLVSITILNLFQPYGRILVTVFSLPVTQGALELGLRRAGVLIGLIYLSRFMVISRPRFPGRLGGLLSMQFTFYEGFLTRKISLRPSHIIDSLDELLLLMDEQGGSSTGETKLVSPGASVLAVLCFWALFILGVLPIWS